jgi:hypothetical protein
MFIQATIWRQKILRSKELPARVARWYSYLHTKNRTLEDLRMGNILCPVTKFHVPLVFVHMLLPFGICYGLLVNFFRFGMLYNEKSVNPVPYFRSKFQDLAQNATLHFNA